MKLQRVFMILMASTFFMASCKKEIPVIPAAPTNLLEVDLTGMWNGYGYMDMSGLVPLEIIQITRSDTNPTYYIATKITGDKAVSAGLVTWEGDAISNPFTVSLGFGAGPGNYFLSPGAGQMEIIDPNTIEQVGPGAHLIFVRRTDSHF